MNLNRLVHLLDEGDYKYTLQGNKFSFKDDRVCDLMNNKNFGLYESIRKDAKIEILDLSHCGNTVGVIANFPYLKEIIMPKIVGIMPKIENCPNIENVVFDDDSIKIIKENSFEGWPKLRLLRFGKSLELLEPFAICCEVEEIDLSKCLRLKRIPEHAFQQRRHPNFRLSLKKVRLPSSVTVIPMYAFFQCLNLREIEAEGVLEISYKSLSCCFNLGKCYFSEDLDTQQTLSDLPRNFSDEGYELSRFGVILDDDDVYFYIWCFIDFKFYFCKKDSHFSVNDFVAFKRSAKREFNIDNGTVEISSDYNKYMATSLELNGFKPRSKYDSRPRVSGLKVSCSDLQLDGIRSYKRLLAKRKIDMRVVIQDIYNKVGRLNIEDIINSYKTEVSEEVITKVGGDDRFYQTIETKSYYSDGYLETLLPSYISHSSDRGYTSMWDYLSEDQKKVYLDRDEKRRQSARHNYSKDEHIKFLIHEYMNEIEVDATKSEQYLHIARAKELFERYENLIGEDKVCALNKLQDIL